MESTRTPSGLQQWVELLQDKRLPVPARSLTLLRRQLQSANVSLQQLSPIIAADPVLSMHCVSLANRLNRNPDTDVSTIDLAVATLGLVRIRELSGQLPAITLNSASIAHKQYFHALADSYHAATQAQTLCRYHDRSIINSTRLAALFYGIGHWALWRYAPQQMSQIKIRIHEQQQDTALAESEVLGCTIQQISEQLTNHWCLSRLAVQALQHQTSPDAEKLHHTHLQAKHPNELSDAHKRDVKQLLNAPYYPVKLANWLALTTPLGWSHPKTLLIQQLISDLLQQPVDEVVAQLHRNCVTASREHRLPGLLSPAAMLLLLPSSLVLNYRLISADSNGADTNNSTKRLPQGSTINPNALPQPTARSVADSPSAAAAPVADYRDPALFQTVLQQLQTQAGRFDSRDQILQRLLEGIVDGLGLARMLSYPVNADMQLAPVSQTLISYSGCNNNAPLINFSLDLRIPSLFKQLTHKPLSILIDNHNRDKAWIALPERFKSICHPHSFILSSIFIDNQPALILYADRRDSDKRIHASQLQRYKLLTAAASDCLNALNRKAR